MIRDNAQTPASTHGGWEGVTANSRTRTTLSTATCKPHANKPEAHTERDARLVWSCDNWKVCE